MKVSSKERQRRKIIDAVSVIRAASGSTQSANHARQLAAIQALAEAGAIQTIEPLLPLMLNLKGHPYHLTDHFPFAPFFRTRRPLRTLWRTGRQVSKCLPISNIRSLYLANGQRVCGSSVRVGDRVLSVDDNLRSVSGIVTDVVDAGYKPILRITTRTGAVLDVATTHPFRTLNGWTRAHELHVGSRIAAVRAGGIFEDIPIDRARIILTAYLIGDEHCGSNGGLTITSACAEVLEEAGCLLAAIFGQAPHRLRSSAASELRFSAKGQVGAWLQSDGLFGKKSWEKFIPSWVFSLSRSDTALFLSRLWATDGMIRNEKTKSTISYTSTSQQLAFDVRALLTKFGIPSTIKRRKTSYRKKGVQHFCRDAYVLRVETRDGWQKFLNTFCVPGKPAPVMPTSKSNNNRDTVPIEINDWIFELTNDPKYRQDQNSLFSAGLRRKPKYPLSKTKLAEYVRYFQKICPEHPRLKQLIDLQTGDLYWDQIVSIATLPSAPCWDIEVQTYHNYILDGILVHNTTSTGADGVMVAGSIPNFQTLYVTPRFEQIRRFSANVVRPFIEGSPVRSMWINTTTENSVLQRSFRNLSRMVFSFALLDADRIRGVSSDKVSIDESERIGTMVDTPAGQKAIETFQPGDPIWSIDENGQVHEDTVVKCSDHGVRDCYRIGLSNGDALEATSETFIATTAGWKRISSIITDHADSAADTNAARHNAGGRQHVHRQHEARSVSQQPRIHSKRVQHSEIPGIVTVCYQSSREEAERRLRRLDQSLGHLDGLRAISYRILVSPRREETGDPGLAKSNDLGRDCVVVSGRRKFAGSRSGFQHSRILPNGGPTPGFLADATWYRRQGKNTQKPAQPSKEIPNYSPICRCDIFAGRENPGIHSSRDAIQSYAAAESRIVGLPLVPTIIYSRQESGDLSRDTCSAVLQEADLSFGEAQSQQRKTSRKTRLSRTKKSTTTGGVFCGRCGATKQSCGSHTEISGGESGKISSISEGVSSEKESGETCSCLLSVPNVISMVGEETSAILPGLSKDRDNRDQTPFCAEAEIVSITWTGKHRVFDIETAKYRTFFAGGIAVHNCQDMDRAHLPIIFETLSYSDYGIIQLTGTPKTKDNTLDDEWSKSSQAEWFVPCSACGHWNIPSIEFDIDKMIGPARDDISEHAPGTICARCERPVNPRYGRWVHRQADRQDEYAGYHVPQIIMPLHFSRPGKWANLVGKRDGIGATTPNRFYNEVLGESYDMAQKLISQTELQRACVLPIVNDPRHISPELTHRAQHYLMRILAVDWGGGGEDGISYTVGAVLGLTPDGVIEVIYGRRLMTPHAHVAEAKELRQLYRAFRCDFLAHDYTGAGTVRETVLLQQGLPVERVIPVSYVRAASRNIITHVPATDIHPRSHYRVDKTRSLLYTCTAIKMGRIRFFEWDRKSAQEPGLISDFLNLVENKVSTNHGSDIYLIQRANGMSDDFAQAVNIGTVSLWHVNQLWPDFGDLASRLAEPLSELDVLDAGDRDHGWEQLSTDFGENY